MPTPGTVLQDCDPHTRATRRMLETYLRARLPALLTAYATVTFADGYAGPGVYATGEPGAPVIAGRELVAALRAGAGSAARLVLVEPDERRITRLTYEVAVNTPRDGRVRSLYEKGECADALIPALAASGADDGAMFVLLDGRAEPIVPHAVLAALGAPGAGTGEGEGGPREGVEVLMTVDPERLLAVAGDPSRPAEGDAVFGGSGWRGVFDQPPPLRLGYLVDAYRRSALPGAGFELTLTVEMVDGGGRPLYVIFGTNERRAVETMKDAMWGVGPDCGVRYRDPHDAERRALDAVPRPDVGPLREAILDYVGSGDKGATVNELRGHISRATIYKDSQVAGVVRRLIGEGQLENRSAGGLAGRSFVGRPKYVTGSLF